MVAIDGPRPAMLVFRSTCAKCRRLSRMAEWLSWGAIRRIPHDAPELRSALVDPALRNKLLLIGDGRVVVGRAVIVASLWWTVRRWLRHGDARAALRTGSRFR
jgi:hypothetical protein